MTFKERHLLEEKTMVSNKEQEKLFRELAKKEGLDVGYTHGDLGIDSSFLFNIHRP